MTESAASARNRNRLGFGILSVLAGIGIFLLFFHISGLHINDIIETLRHVRLEWVLACAASTLLHFYLSALKWQITLRETAATPDEVYSGFFCLTVTGLGAALGQFLPLTISTVLTRSIGTKLQQNGTMTRSAASTVYEQGMDLFVALVVGLVSIPAIANWISFQEWLLLSSIALTLTGILLVYFLHTGLRIILSLMKLLPSTLWLVQWSTLKIEAVQASGTFAARLTVQLYLLSIVRYINIVVGLLCIIQAVQMPIAASLAFYTMPLVQLASILSITPGNLGIAEWTLTGILVGGGVASGVAAEFSVLFRIILFCVVISLNVGIVSLYTFTQQRHSTP